MSADAGLGEARDCKLVNCTNTLETDDPTRGIWANICKPCRRGETPQGVLYRESRNIGGNSPREPVVKGELEAKARAIVPLAKKLEQKVRISKVARADAAVSVTEFARALDDLRGAAQALISKTPDGD